jgi:hypothetical protein
MVLVAVARLVEGTVVRGLLIALVVATGSAGWVGIQLVEVRYHNVYGDGTCEPTEAVGASFRIGVQPGVLLNYPSEVRRLERCNEAQRSSQLERLPPVRSP